MRINAERERGLRWHIIDSFAIYDVPPLLHAWLQPLYEGKKGLYNIMMVMNNNWFVLHPF